MLIASLAASVVALAIPAAASAAFPGANGKIAFDDAEDTCYPEFESRIHTINPDGTGLTEIVPTVDGADCAPAWSPDGQRIVFERTYFNEGQQVEIWVMNADGTGQTHLPNGDDGFEPAFSADGQSVYFTRRDGTQNNDTEIYRMNSSPGGSVDQLTDNDVDDFEPTASASGALVAFAREPGTARSAGPRFFSASFADIWTMTPAGASQTDVTPADSGYDHEAPNFSPDSSTIAFARCAQEFGECIEPGHIASVSAGGGAITEITDNSSEFLYSDDDPAYAPDGSRIVYWRLNLDGFFGELAFVVPVMGGAITSFVDGFRPDWQPLAAPSGPSSGGVAGAVGKPKARCFGEDVTIFGTNGPDKIFGTKGPDVIRGFKGRDKINGRGDGDILCGGRGKDKLFGKNGDDILIGGAQSDYLNGGKGINRLFGGTPGAPFEEATNVCVNTILGTLSNCQVVK